MAVNKRYKRYTTWNNIRNKPEIVNVEAVEKDIVLKIKQMWFMCRYEHGMNSIYCFLTPGKHMTPKNIMCAMFDFIYRLGTEYGIEYISVRGKYGKYNFVSRLFPNDVVLDPVRKPDGDEVRYCHLSKEALNRLNQLRQMDGRETK